MKLTKNSFLFIITAILIVIVDQISKYLIHLFKPSFEFAFFIIRYSQNTGAAFGIFQNATIFLAIISLIVASSIIWYYPKLEKEKTIVHLFFGLLLGGTIGNLIDRIARRYVIDFIGTTFWPFFNVADAAITISVIGLIMYWSIEEYKLKKKN